MVRWAPLDIPLSRRVQTAAVVVCGALFPATLAVLVAAATWAPAVAAGSRVVLAVYVAWIVLVDRGTPRNGGRPSTWVRNWRLWAVTAAYFPARLVILGEPPEAAGEVDGDSAAAPDAGVSSSSVPPAPPVGVPVPVHSAAGDGIPAAPADPAPAAAPPVDAPPLFRRDKPHIFALHPHGVISVSAICNLLWNGNHALERIGLDYRIVTVTFNFLVPLWRELIMAMGFIDASKGSIHRLLRSGKSCMIVIGGAQETLHAAPGVTELVLLKRRGFVRLALQHGANLVPVFHFGENDLYGQVRHPLLRRLQQAFLRVTGFTLPVIRGRGIFNYDVGIVPRRLPLTTVVGRPIEVPHIPDPTDDDITRIHTTYMTALAALYNDHKDKYAHATDYHGRPVVPPPLSIVA